MSAKVFCRLQQFLLGLCVLFAMPACGNNVVRSWIEGPQQATSDSNGNIVVQLPRLGCHPFGVDVVLAITDQTNGQAVEIINQDALKRQYPGKTCCLWKACRAYIIPEKYDVTSAVLRSCLVDPGNASNNNLQDHALRVSTGWLANVCENTVTVTIRLANTVVNVQFIASNKPWC